MSSEFLVDIERGERRFRLRELLAEGQHYQIALADDTHLDDHTVCVKTVAYRSEHFDDPKYVAGRRAALKKELDFLTLPSHLLPEPLDWLEIRSEDVPGGREPVLVYEYQHGQTLLNLIRERHPQGLPPERALRLFRELAQFAARIHGAGWVFRDFDPRHIIVGFDDVIHLVGCGNATQLGQRLNPYTMDTNHAYTAPEIRHEISGQFLKPAADIWSLGCLFSFMLTGTEPRERAESPIEADAFEKLQEDIEEGYRLLVARCLQPLAKNRFTKVSKMLPWLTPDSLPKRADKKFGMVMLPQPWPDQFGRDNRGVHSKLSAGPLISVQAMQKMQDEVSPRRQAKSSPGIAQTAPSQNSAGLGPDASTTPEVVTPDSKRGPFLLWAGGIFFVLLVLLVITLVVLGLIQPAEAFRT